MPLNKRIAVIGLSTLSAIGIKSLIRGETEMRISLYRSLDEFRSSGEQAEGFIISSEMFVSDLDFFMPRRQKVLVVSDTDISDNSQNKNLIFNGDDEPIVEEKVVRLLETISHEDVERGELSVREKEVLRLLVKGKINKEIADELCISVNTVITHRKNITSKTGIKSVSGLSIYALMNGISS